MKGRWWKRENEKEKRGILRKRIKRYLKGDGGNG
jgi:hypothetical protein